MSLKLYLTEVPVSFCKVCGVHQALHVRKNEAAKETVAIATGTPNGLIHCFQLSDLGNKDRTA